MNGNTKVKMTCLWKRQSNAGDTYLEGNLSYSSKPLVFANKNKTDKGPGYIAHLVLNEPKEKPQSRQEHSR